MEIKELEIKKIKSKENVRLRDYENDRDLVELMESIKNVGLLQPIGVIKEENNYKILFGNRRLLAYKKLGRKFIPSRIFETKDDIEFFTVNLIENVQRKDVSVLEQSRILNELLASGLTTSEIAVRVSMPHTRVKTILKMYNVPKEYQNKIYYSGAGKQLRKGKIPATIADTILQFKITYRLTTSEVNKLFKIAKEHELKTSELRIIAVLLKNKFELNDALKIMNNIEIIRSDIPVFRKQLKTLMKKHNVRKLELIKKIVYGEIIDDFDMHDELKYEHI